MQISSNEDRKENPKQLKDLKTEKEATKEVKKPKRKC